MFPSILNTLTKMSINYEKLSLELSKLQNLVLF